MPRKDGVRPGIAFSAVVGQEDAKTALLVAAVSPHIRSVLLKGPAGTAKTALARSVPGIDPGRTVANVPLNVSDERLFGSLDVEKAISGGKIELSSSLLMEADGNYIYVDDCDRMDPRSLTSMMDYVAEGKVKIERDGISGSYPVDTTVIASMYAGSKGISPHVNDSFDICVTMRRDKSDIPGAMEVLRRNLEPDQSEDTFANQDQILAQRIQDARLLLPETVIERHLVRYISKVCRDYGVPGCRGAIATAHTARALAALDGRKAVDEADVTKACILCLMHRRTVDPEEEKRKQKLEWKREADARKVDNIVWDGARIDAAELEKRVDSLQEQDAEPAEERVDILEGRKIEIGKGADQYSIKAELRSGIAGRKDTEEEPEGDVMDLLKETIAEIDLLNDEDSNGMRQGDEVAKRMYSETVGGRGKYIRSREPSGPVRDIAFDATIRAAAPFQRIRGASPGSQIIIEKSDVREKVREKEIMSTFLFVIDASASLDVGGQFYKVRRAVNSMLLTHYVNRDRVALMTFNEKGIVMRLHPSRNAEKITSVLNRISIDYGTPLSETLSELVKYLVPYTLKNPDELIHVVMITDGRATVSMDPSKDPSEEALEIASTIDIPNVDWIVIDTGTGYTKNEVPPKLALILHGKYFLLDDLQPKDDGDSWRKWDKKGVRHPFAQHACAGWDRT